MILLFSGLTIFSQDTTQLKIDTNKLRLVKSTLIKCENDYIKLIGISDTLLINNKVLDSLNTEKDKIILFQRKKIKTDRLLYLGAGTFLGIILGFGIIVITLAVLNILPQIIADTFGRIISLMNSFIGWVSKQEAFLLKDIAFSLLYVIVFYVLIITFVRLLFKRNYLNLKLFLKNNMAKV